MASGFFSLESSTPWILESYFSDQVGRLLIHTNTAIKVPLNRMNQKSYL